MKGFFIVFDGLDGSGKGTLIESVKRYLLGTGAPSGKLFLTAEPTKGFYGKKVRELLASNVNPEVNAKSFLDLYVADRKEHVEREILPALKKGKIILCDRYKYSTFVYQSLQGMPMAEIRNLHKSLPVPDCVFILDVPAELALKRISSDSKRSAREVFENEGFLNRVRRQFLSIEDVFPDENIFIIDSSSSREEVLSEVRSILEKKLAKFLKKQFRTK